MSSIACKYAGQTPVSTTALASLGLSVPTAAVAPAPAKTAIHHLVKDKPSSKLASEPRWNTTLQPSQLRSRGAQSPGLCFQIAAGEGSTCASISSPVLHGSTLNPYFRPFPG